MFESFALLPYRGLDQSLLLPVLVGVVVLALFTELFGVAFVGVVVPGYLAAVAVAQPTAAGGMLVEAIATYLIVRMLSDGVRRSDAWAVFFGRERFFLIVLVSVFVRQSTQTWLFPGGSAWLARETGLDVQVEGELMSIGLVLVPLLANMFWKPGLRRGLLHALAPVTVTYVLLAFVLLPYTNLSLSSIELSFEGVAIDFMTSGKAYIVMLTASLLAARFNLRYGWDFGGILVPGLLAVAWLEPVKIGTTALEGLVLAGTTALALRLPVLRTLNMEGPRKLVIVFGLGFLLKLVAGWALGDRYPAMKITELFGFGYLLPALLGVKILERRVVARVVGPALVTSLLGFAIGSGIGFGLELLAPRMNELSTRDPAELAQGRLLPDRPHAVVLGAAADARTKVAARLDTEQPGTREGARLGERLGPWVLAGGPASEELHDAALAIGLAIRPVSEPGSLRAEAATVVALEPVPVPRAGAGAGTMAPLSGIVRPGSDGPWLFVPRPRSEPLSAPGALMLCARISCGAILVSAFDEGGEPAPPRSALRGLAAELRVPAVFVRVPSRTESEQLVLHVRGRLPSGLDLAGLSPNPAALRWDPPSGAAWTEWSGDVVLWMPEAEMARMLAASGPVPAVGPMPWAEPMPAAGHTQADAWLVGRWSERGALRALAEPRQSGLIALQLEVERLLSAAVAEDPDRLAASAAIVDGLGWSVARFERCDEQGPCWVLDLGATAEVTVAVREGAAQPLAVVASAAGTELGTRALATMLWSQEEARALVLADVGRQPEAQAVLDSIHRAVDRVVGVEPGAMALHVRGLADHRAMTSEVVWGTDRPILDEQQVPAGLEALRASSGTAGTLLAQATPIDGDARFAGLLDARPQHAFSREVGGLDVVTLWLGSQVRQRWARRSPTAWQRLALRSGMALSMRDPRAAALDGLPEGPWGGGGEAGPAFLEEARRAFVSRHVGLMRRLAALDRDHPDIELELGWDELRGRAWLMATERHPGAHERVLLLDTDSECSSAWVDLADPMATEALGQALAEDCREIVIGWYGEGGGS